MSRQHDPITPRCCSCARHVGFKAAHHELVLQAGAISPLLPDKSAHSGTSLRQGLPAPGSTQTLCSVCTFQEHPRAKSNACRPTAELQPRPLHHSTPRLQLLPSKFLAHCRLCSMHAWQNTHMPGTAHRCFGPEGPLTPSCLWRIPVPPKPKRIPNSPKHTAQVCRWLTRQVTHRKTHHVWSAHDTHHTQSVVMQSVLPMSAGLKGAMPPGSSQAGLKVQHPCLPPASSAAPRDHRRVPPPACSKRRYMHVL